MAELTVSDRVSVWESYMREPAVGETFSVTKSVLREAINAADTWLDTTFASFNAALPLTAQTGLLRDQKLRLLLMVIERRFTVKA